MLQKSMIKKTILILIMITTMLLTAAPSSAMVVEQLEDGSVMMTDTDGSYMIKDYEGGMKVWNADGNLVFSIEPRYTTVDAPNNHIVPDGTPNDGVAVLFLGIDTDGDGIADGTGRCTGSLLPDRIHVLTAGHCVTNGDGVRDIVSPSTATFQGDDGDQTIAINVAWTQIHPDWDGQLLCGDDIAIVELVAEPTDDIPSYPIDTILEDDIDIVGNKFGYGRTGTGDTGDTINFDGFKRTGQNLYEDTQLLVNTWSQDNTSFGCPDDQLSLGGVIMYDFDNGLAANDAYGVHFNIANLGLGNNEVNSAPGDSGGPTFNPAREVMGVTSFGAQIIESDGTTSDILPGNIDSSFGEFGGDTRVSFYQEFIDAVISSKGEIHGMKFDDLNGNGEKDDGEPGISGWEMDLDCANEHDDSTETDDDGNYWFLNIPTLDGTGGPAPTTCTVTEETIDGWTPTSPDTAPDSAVKDVNPGDVIEDVDFGNWKDVTIMGEKWEDTDEDGIDNANAEPRLADWEITLANEDAGLEQSVLTDDQGKYTFGPLGPEWAGDATICETVQPGWIPIHPGTNCITITIESGGDLGAVLPDDDTDFGNLLVIEAEKTWTHTDYNWGPVVDPDGTTRPANINNDDDDVLADALPIVDNKYELSANIHPKNDKFQNTQPGAFYALTTVDVLADINQLTVWEDYGDVEGDCTDKLLKLLAPNAKPERAVKVAIAAPNGEVTELTDTLSDIDGAIMADDQSAHVELDMNIEAGSTVYVLVKFQHNLKGEDFPNGIMEMCHNEEDVAATIGELPPAEVTAEADLRIQS